MTVLLLASFDFGAEAWSFMCAEFLGLFCVNKVNRK